MHLIDVFDMGDTLKVWIYHKEYGVNPLMLELLMSNFVSEGFGFDNLAVVIKSILENEHYIEMCGEEYME